MNTRRILCVHEGPGLQKLRKALEIDGYEVLPAANGIKALDLLSSQQVDGVVLDFDAEAPGGLTLRHCILHQRPDMPMLLFGDLDELKAMPLEVFRGCLQTTVGPASVFAHIRN